MVTLAVGELLDRLDAPLPLTSIGAPAEPLQVVDLATAPDGIDRQALGERLGARPQVTIGVLPADPSPQALLLAPACTLTLKQVPAHDGRAFAVPVDDIDAALRTLAQAIRSAPLAAVSLHQLLHLQSRLRAPAALVAESALYSTLLAGTDFARWLATRPARRPPEPADALAGPIEVTAGAGTVRIALARPARRNAFNAAMRDALIDALAGAALDPSLRVELSGHGPDFCAGGDLEEFGTTPDPVTAHVLRTARSAGLALHRVAGRTTAYLHGNCVGAGIELPAFATRVVARPDIRIRLPELGMGLIPGAGGTVCVTGRIGRWRTAWLALTGTPLTARTARAWGLVDEVRP